MLGAPDSAFGAQMLQQLLLQYAARLYIKASVYRFVRHLFLRFFRERTLEPGSAPGRGVIPTLARAEWSLARSSGEVRAGCWAAMDVLR